jgi:ribose transport system substrate-binding protein
MECWAKKAAAARGINLIWQGSQSYSPRDEMQALQAVVAQNPDAILLVPWDSTAFIAPAKEIMKSGIPVITVDGSLTEPVDIQNIRTNNRDAGIQAAKDLAGMIGGKGAILILTDTPGNAVQNERWHGFKETIDQAHKDIAVLEVQYIGGDAAKAASVTTSAIVAHPDLAAVYTTDGTGAEGAANAVRAADKRGKIRVVGYDATPRQVELLKAGEFDALVAQSTYDLSTRMIESIEKVLREGRTAAGLPYQVHTPFKFLTRDNIDEADSKHFIYAADCG